MWPVTRLDPRTLYLFLKNVYAVVECLISCVILRKHKVLHIIFDNLINLLINNPAKDIHNLIHNL